MDAAKRCTHNGTRWGQKGADTGALVAGEPSGGGRHRDRPRAEAAVPNHDARRRACEARDAAPAQQPAASARTTRAAAEVPRADVAPASMPAASPSEAARPPRRRQRGAATSWRRSCYHRRDCCRRSVTAAFRPRRTTGRMNCARCVRSDSSGSRARASPPSFRSASMKSSKTSSPLACAASCRRGSCRTSSRSAPPSRPSFAPSFAPSLPPSLLPSLHPRPASPLALALLCLAGRTSLSPMSPHAQTYLNGTSNRRPTCGCAALQE